MIHLNSPTVRLCASRDRSIRKMDDHEFNDLYRAAINVLWTFILNKSFPTIAEAENAAAQLMDYAA